MKYILLVMSVCVCFAQDKETVSGFEDKNAKNQLTHEQPVDLYEWAGRESLARIHKKRTDALDKLKRSREAEGILKTSKPVYIEVGSGENADLMKFSELAYIFAVMSSKESLEQFQTNHHIRKILARGFPSDELALLHQQVSGANHPHVWTEKWSAMYYMEKLFAFQDSVSLKSFNELQKELVYGDYLAKDEWSQALIEPLSKKAVRVLASYFIEKIFPHGVETVRSHRVYDRLPKNVEKTTARHISSLEIKLQRLEVK